MKAYDVLIARGDRDHLDTLLACGEIVPITGMLDEENAISFYFDGGVLDEGIIARLESFVPAGSVRFERGEVAEQNWNLEFEKSLQPVRVTDDLIITQSWNGVDAPAGTLVVTIDPKMSFGTGHHESTRLIARLMTTLDLGGKSLLDVGTGTGALAIIAAKRGATRIVAFDNNEWAVENTRENIALNDVDDAIELFLGELDDLAAETFDVIVANLHRSLITRLLPDLRARLAGPDARLLTSGVLIEDYDELLAPARANGFEPIAEERENEWVATMFGLRHQS